MTAYCSSSEPVRTCPHERLLSGLKKQDSLCRATGGDVQSLKAARTFSVSLSSVKRYVKKAERGESLAPKKRPGSPPKLDAKAMKLLGEDLKERPFATLKERRDYVEVLSGISVSRSTMCRAIARIGPTRKKGGE